MNSMQKMVEEFHKKYKFKINKTPTLIGEDLLKFRIQWIEEEIKELKDAGKSKNIVEMADGMGYAIYLILGLAVSMGIDLEPIFTEIHRSNMTKERSDKKIAKAIKGKNFIHPDILRELFKQGYN